MEKIELIKNYSEIIQKLKQKDIIRTKNVVGEIGEYYAINYFNNKKGLPKLQRALISAKNIDAISIRGERYNIKTTTSNVTGAFWGMKKEEIVPEKIFEYVLIVTLNNDYTLKSILQIDFNTFLRVRCWNNGIKAWNIRINKKLLEQADIIYKSTNKL